jgi:hypothetical protein
MGETRTHEELIEAAVTRLERLLPSMAPRVRSDLADAVATSVEQKKTR